jgi:hypothetical protein
MSRSGDFDFRLWPLADIQSCLLYTKRTEADFEEWRFDRGERMPFDWRREDLRSAFDPSLNIASPITFASTKLNYTGASG